MEKGKKASTVGPACLKLLAVIVSQEWTRLSVRVGKILIIRSGIANPLTSFIFGFSLIDPLEILDLRWLKNSQ